MKRAGVAVVGMVLGGAALVACVSTSSSSPQQPGFDGSVPDGFGSSGGFDAGDSALPPPGDSALPPPDADAGAATPSGVVVAKQTTKPGPAFAAVVQPDGKLVVAAAGSLSGTQSFTLIRFNADATLDTSFGIGGSVAGNLGGQSVSGEQVWALALQPDGKLVVGGTGTGVINSVATRQFALARYDAAGTLDASFGVGGKVFSDFGNGRSSDLKALAVQTNGAIVAVGNTPGATTSYNFALARFLPSGSLDASFGTGGRVVTAYNTALYDNAADSVALQADGKLLVAGYYQNGQNVMPALARYNADGSLDATFATAGIVLNDGISAPTGRTRVAVQQDGKVVLSASVDVPSAGADFMLSRYNADGTLDSAFGTAGRVTTDVGNGQDDSYALALQPDGKILVAGRNTAGTSDPNAAFGVLRYQANGSLDATFGSGGKSFTEFGASVAPFCYALALAPSGGIFAVGGAPDGTGSSVTTIARFTQ